MFSAAEWLTDYDEMLAREDIDAIGVVTPSGMHCDFALRALQAGKLRLSLYPSLGQSIQFLDAPSYEEHEED